jgi:tellurite resistance protein TehA-like permease
MSLGIRLILLGFGIVLFVVIFELVRRRRFREELSIAWFAVSVMLMASSTADKVIDPFAKRLGIGYPPALVFAWLIFCLILALLYFSSVISDLKGKIKELSQKIALMELEVDKKRNTHEGGFKQE